MTPPLSADPYSRRLADLILEHDRRLATLEGGQRATQLGNSSIEDDFIAAYDALGQARQIIGRQNDGTFSITYGNGPAPPVPSGVNIAAGQLSLIVQWDGTFVGGAARPKDFARLDVHVSETNGFTPSPLTAVASLFDEGAISLFADSDTKYVKVIAVNNSDVPSSSTAQVTILPLPADQIAAGAIGATQLAALIVLTNRLVAGNPTGARVEMNNTGLKAVNSSGVETITLDGSTGNATFRGVYRTDNQGQERLVINDDVSNATTIRFFGAGDNVNHGSMYKIDANNILTVHGFTLSSNRGELIFDGRPGNGFLSLQYGDPQGWVTGGKALLLLNQNYSILQAPQPQIYVNEQFPTDAGGTHKFLFGTKDSTGALITSSVLEYQTFGTSPNREPRLNCPNRNIALIWGNAKLHVTTSSATYTTGPIRASAFETFPSSRALKRNIKEPVDDPLEVVEKAPTYQWQAVEGDSGRVHIGPMLEDLPDSVKAKDDQYGDGLDLGSLVGTLMGAVQKLSRKVKKLEDRIAVLEAQ
jgi:hypothetical protein